MVYTNHGHHIPGTARPNEIVLQIPIRCGGPGVCIECSYYADAFYLEMETKMTTPIFSEISETPLFAELVETPTKETTVEDTTAVHKYARKPFVVEAVQFLPEENFDFVADWAGGIPLMVDGVRVLYVKVVGVKDSMTLTEGDWVTKVRGSLRVYPTKAFERTFARTAD